MPLFRIRSHRTLYFFTAILFFVTSYVALDPDFGWHIRFGQLILTTHQVPITDPFSFSMPSYHFVDHEWLLDTFQALLYPFIGRMGLAMIFTVIIMVSIHLSEQLSKEKIPMFLFLAAVGSLYSSVGLRDQVISWLFFSVLLQLLYNNRLKKYSAFLPVLFLIWANVHGAFLLGLLFYWIVFVMRTIEKKEFTIMSASLILASTVITLFNPYGVNLWFEVIRSTPAISFINGINEWLPVISSPNLANAIFLVFSTALTIAMRRSLGFIQLLPFIFLFIMGVIHVRNLPFFILYSLSFLPFLIQKFEAKVRKVPFALKRYQVGMKYIGFIISIILIPQFFFLLRDSFLIQESTYYPLEAVTYLSSAPPQRIFSPYNWGGYILWKLPETKVFIDGRMPHWQQKVINNESTNAYEESSYLLSGKVSIVPFVKKYHIDTFLFSKIKPTSYQPILIKDLESLGWKKVYADNLTIILR